MIEILIDLGDKLSDVCHEIIEQDLGEPKENIENLKDVCDVFLSNTSRISDFENMLILILNASYKSGIKVMQLLERTELRLQEIKGQENEWTFEEPHFVNSENCMGRSEQYWRVWAKCNGKLVAGFGLNKEQALLDCEIKTKKEKYRL